MRIRCLSAEILSAKWWKPLLYMPTAELAYSTICILKVVQSLHKESELHSQQHRSAANRCIDLLHHAAQWNLELILLLKVRPCLCSSPRTSVNQYVVLAGVTRKNTAYCVLHMHIMYGVALPQTYKTSLC